MADDEKTNEQRAAENELIREGIALNEKNLKIAEKALARQEAASALETERPPKESRGRAEVFRGTHTTSAKRSRRACSYETKGC